MTKVLFFSPHSAIWEHAFPEALLAEALMQDAVEVVYVTCGRQLASYCIAMSAAGLSFDSAPEEKRRICQKCEGNARVLRGSFRFNGPDLSGFIQPEDEELIERLLNGINEDNFSSYSIDGINIGRLALYEFLLNYKKNDFRFTTTEWQAYLAQVRNCLYAFYGCGRILDAEKPTRVVAYNTLYSVNHICAKLAEQRGIPHYLIHSGGSLSCRLQTMLINRQYSLMALNKSSHWERYKSVPCGEELLAKVTDHLLELFRGRNVFAYSAPIAERRVELRQFFGIRPEQKVLLATMSSRDERFAAETIGVMPTRWESIFPTQIEWVEALIAFARKRQDLFLVIRVHPREFPNKRERVTSTQARLLETLFVALPENVKINWPNDNISLYDLAEIVDVVLNAWSNAGKEMTLLGIPTVIYSPAQIFAYPHDLNYVGNSVDLYFSQIDRALTDGWSIENMRKAYRWCVFEFCRSTVDLSDSVHFTENPKRSFINRASRWLIRRWLPAFEQENDCRTRASRLKDHSVISAVIGDGLESVAEARSAMERESVSLAQETEFLRREITRIINGLYPGRSARDLKENALYMKLSGAVQK